MAEQSGTGGGKRESQEGTIKPTPFGFTKRLLGDKRIGRLQCSTEEVNLFLQQSLSYPMREQDMDANRAVINPTPSTIKFNLRELSLKEVEGVIKAARSSSTPGPSGVPYIVYNRCPELLRHLWKILKVIW